MRRTRKHNRYSKIYSRRRRGGGIGASKLPPLPPLPPSPPSTPRNKKPSISTNNENLIVPKPGTKEYLRRKERLLTMREGLSQGFINRLIGRKNPKVPLNNYGDPESAFNVKNTGFKTF